MLFLAIVIILCDQISSSIIKEIVGRLRPSHEPELEGIVRLLNGHKSGKFSFTSSHATNSFGLAMFSALLYKNWRYTVFIFIWAAINSYSRIYLGLHYPADILGGLILGITIAFLIFWIYKKVIFNHVKDFKYVINFENEVYIPFAGGVFSIIIILLSARTFI